MSTKMDLPIERVAFDPSGERLALGIAHLGSVVVGLGDGAVIEGALSKDASTYELSSEGALSPDRSMMAHSGTEPRVWDVPSGQVLRRMGRHEQHALLSWTEEAVTIVGTDGTQVRFRTATGELWDRRPRPLGFDDARTISAGGSVLMVGSGRSSGLRAVRIDAPSPAVSLAWPGAMDGVVAAAASARGDRIAVSASEQVVVFDATTGAALAAFAPRGTNPLESNSPSAVALDDEGQLVAAIVHGEPRVWDIGSRREIPLLPGDCSDVKFQPKSSLVVAACHEQVRLWDGRTGAALVTIDSSDVPETFFFDPAGTRVAQLGHRHLTLLDGRTLVTLGKTEPLPPSMTAAFSPSGKIVAVGMQNGAGIEFYRAADGKRLADLQLWPNDEAWTVQSHDGKVEVFGDVDKVRKQFMCRVDTKDFPLPACEERLFVKGLFRDILTERIAETP
jgi:WD40 repeat protein